MDDLPKFRLICLEHKLYLASGFRNITQDCKICNNEVDNELLMRIIDNYFTYFFVYLNLILFKDPQNAVS